jgi:hypothetical protein
MASDRQIEANRGNATRSTGPRTEAGKIRSSRNSFCHGLSRQMTDAGDCQLRTEGPAGAPGIVGTGLEIARIRVARSELLAAFIRQPDPKLAKRLRGIDRYERQALARQKKLLRNRAELEDDTLRHSLDAMTLLPPLMMWITSNR